MSDILDYKRSENTTNRVCFYEDKSKRYRYSCDKFVIYADNLEELYATLGYYPAMCGIKRTELVSLHSWLVTTRLPPLRMLRP